MNEQVKTIYLNKLLDDPKEKETFIDQMNMRFDVIKELMQTLKSEIETPDQDRAKEIKSIFCAFKLMMYLDDFADDMNLITKEARGCC